MGFSSQGPWFWRTALLFEHENIWSHIPVTILKHFQQPRAYRAVYEEGPEDDDSEEDWAGGLDDLEVAVLVCEEDHHGETADDDALEDEENGPEDHVEGDNAGRAVHTLLTSLGTLETLELRL